jgi:hypothetical protein
MGGSAHCLFDVLPREIVVCKQVTSLPGIDVQEVFIKLKNLKHLSGMDLLLMLTKSNFTSVRTPWLIEVSVSVSDNSITYLVLVNCAIRVLSSLQK